ncbi:MAG: cytochrome c3 family protein [Dehalococcoidia bacterium]|nr:cytochrome c3 family protein [Dehalococcoidia bacterium]
MPKKFILGLVVVIALAYGLVSTGSEAAPAGVSMQMTAGRNLNSIAYNIILKNPTANPIGNVFVSGLVPDGTKYVDKSATSGGTLQGNQVTWVLNQVAAKGQTILTYKVGATAPAIGTNHAWAHWLSPSDSTAMSAEVAADYQLISLKGVNTRADHEKLPDGKVALTTTAGKGHQEDEIVSSALSNVGVGEYIFLQGAKHDNLENDITSWNWRLIGKPLGSTASLESTDKQVTRFVPDRVGEYLVEVTSANSKGQATASTNTVTAGKFAGISLCASCHDGSVPGAKDIMTTFVKTGHADKFEGTWNSYTPDRDYCIRCHTVGYNELANNGGMDDAARASGWDPKLGSVLAWLKKNSWTLDQVKADPNMGRTINIQCENCHGPGATAHTGTKSFDPGVCGQCHPQPMQWQNAAHAKVDPHMATNSSCARCHTGQGYVEEWVRGETLVMADQATLDKPANVPPIEQQSGISCATCHDPHAADHTFKSGDAVKSNQLRLEGEITAPMGWKVDAGEAATCVRCHADNRTPQNLKDFVAGTRERGTHENTQADVFYGKGVYDYDGVLKTNNSFHTTFKEACITCHMAANPKLPGPDGKAGTTDDVTVLSVGGHSWNMEAEWEGKKVENIGACTQCHAGTTTFDRPAAGDYDGNGKVEGVQTEVKGLMALLRALLPKDALGEVLNYPVTTANSTEAQRKAMWNYNVIRIDGSNGVHNTAFTVQVLQQTYKQLTGKDVPGATLR